MAEINDLADTRLSSQVSEVITKYDLLADKIEVDIVQPLEQVGELVLKAEASEQSASRSATAAEQSLNMLEQKIASGEFKGEKGDKGDAGATGAQGEQGLQGEQGIQGVQGLQGVTGAQGDKGDKGDTGPQGIQGIQGLKGDSLFMSITAQTWTNAVGIEEVRPTCSACGGSGCPSCDWQGSSTEPRYFVKTPPGGVWAYIVGSYSGVLPGGEKIYEGRPPAAGTINLCIRVA